MCDYHYRLFNASGTEGWYTNSDGGLVLCPGAVDCGEPPTTED
jgi:hypothetical protein